MVCMGITLLNMRCCLVSVQFDFGQVFLGAFSCFTVVIKSAIFSAKLLNIVIVRPAVHCVAMVH